MKQYDRKSGKPDIAAFLKRTKTSQAELSRTLGISKGMVTLMKQGKTDMTRSTCRKLLLAGMTVRELFGDDVAGLVEMQVALDGVKRKLTDSECRRIAEAAVGAVLGV